MLPSLGNPFYFSIDKVEREQVKDRNPRTPKQNEEQYSQPRGLPKTPRDTKTISLRNPHDHTSVNFCSFEGGIFFHPSKPAKHAEQ